MHAKGVLASLTVHHGYQESIIKNTRCFTKDAHRTRRLNVKDMLCSRLVCAATDVCHELVCYTTPSASFLCKIQHKVEHGLLQHLTESAILLSSLCYKDC